MAMRGQEGGEPEAVSEEVQAEITAKAKATYAVVNAEEQRRREARSLANRLRELENRAIRSCTDLGPEIAQVRLALDACEAKLRHAA